MNSTLGLVTQKIQEVVGNMNLYFQKGGELNVKTNG